VGETGAGKTLTVKAILDLLPRGLTATGEVIIDGKVHLNGSSRPSQAAALETAVVLQNPSAMLDPLKKVGDQLTEAVVWHGLLERRAAIARADALLSKMGFPDPSDVRQLYPHQLSGGMAQRAALTMALMGQPRLLVVDEPTSALDAHLRVEVLQIIQRAARDEGSAVLLVSHDLALVSQFCDEVSVMYAGRVIEVGPARRVLEQPAHPYTRMLTSAAATVDAPPRRPLAVIPGAPPAAGQWPSGCVFEPRCPYRFDRCTVERPALPTVQDSAACHLVNG
jgi:oligopeptide/dipeptide ABC transporter ATP-binding protein